MKYIGVIDDSGHEYVIPVKHEDDWWRFIDSLGDDDCADVPEWAHRVNGQISFDEYEVGGKRWK